MKIISIIGARPQFLKEAALSKALKKHHQEIIVNTGQHYDYQMSKVFFGELHIAKPDYDLGVGSSTHGKQTALMIEKLEPILTKEKPDLVIVAGDTNTTLAGAICASKLGIPLAHIEAGMRSFDRSMPEEINRVITDHVSNLHFCSTKTAVLNLRNEGITKGVHHVGDVMIDALKENISIAERRSTILRKLNLTPKQYLLATIHRAGNTDSKENLKRIISAFLQSKELIVFPIHPRTEKYLRLHGLEKSIKNTNIILTGPLGYMDMIVLEKNAKKILTDSGGIQKEAYFFKVPCITLRDSTEWVETVEDGWNMLTGANTQAILKAIRSFNPRGRQTENYKNGKASENIVRVINRSFR